MILVRVVLYSIFCNVPLKELLELAVPDAAFTYVGRDQIHNYVASERELSDQTCRCSY